MLGQGTLTRRKVVLRRREGGSWREVPSPEVFFESWYLFVSMVALKMQQVCRKNEWVFCLLSALSLLLSLF
jgi:hypothetical protein